MYKLIVGHEEPTDEELLDKAIDMADDTVFDTEADLSVTGPVPTGWDKVEAEQYDPPRPVFKEEDEEYILLEFV